jgi:hypothetical protein
VADEGLSAKTLLLRVAGSILLGAVAACGAEPATPVTAVAPARPPAPEFTDDPRPLPRYHSKRLSLSLPLPDGAAWRIDDHTRPELVATHARTRSRVVVALFRAEALVGRSQCEALARDRKLVPEGELHTLENVTDVTQQNYDTRIWVAVEPGSGPGAPMTGHVLAFGGFLRKCYVFDFSTQVDGVSDEPVLSSRLAFARARILGGLELEAFAVVPRETPAPAPAPSGPTPPLPP